MRYFVDFPTRITSGSFTAVDMITNIEGCTLKVAGLVTEISDHDG